MSWFKSKQKQIDDLSHQVIMLTLEKEKLGYEIDALKYKLKRFEPAPQEFKIGDRVKGSEYCAFDRGMKGTVQYVETASGRIWVRRDRSSSDCFYMAKELELIE